MKSLDIKEANRYYWIVKGQLIPETWTLDQVERIYDSYFVRLWHNEEAYVHEDGFVAEWEKRHGIKQTQRFDHGRSRLSGSAAECRTTEIRQPEFFEDSQAACRS